MAASLATKLICRHHKRSDIAGLASTAARRATIHSTTIILCPCTYMCKAQLHREAPLLQPPVLEQPKSRTVTRNLCGRTTVPRINPARDPVDRWPEAESSKRCPSTFHLHAKTTVNIHARTTLANHMTPRAPNRQRTLVPARLKQHSAQSLTILFSPSHVFPCLSHWLVFFSSLVSRPFETPSQTLFPPLAASHLYWAG